MSEKLHQKVSSAAVSNGHLCVPENTSAIYVQAKRIAPDLLNQLFNVHARACEEEGLPTDLRPDREPDDLERRRMLSAVRAAVMRSQTRFG